MDQQAGPNRGHTAVQSGDYIYTFGIRSERVAEGGVGLGVGLGLLLVAAAINVQLPIIALIVAVVIGAVLCFWGVQRLRCPYEVWMGRSGELRFVSVIGTTELDTASIVRIVRVERRSNGELYAVQIEYVGRSFTLDERGDIFRRLPGGAIGSDEVHRITLDGREYIFDWMSQQLRRGMPMTTKQYDDTD
jgi:hypothetical protein